MEENQKLNEDEVIERLAEHYEAIIRLLGDDPSREGMVKTPHRAAKAMYYATRGYRQQLDSVVNGALFESPDSNIIMVRDVEFYSLCEHHMLPFFGHVTIGYIPRGRIIGLSKVARVVDMMARRFQVQERMGKEVCVALQQVLDAEGVAVWCKARHLCMSMRGVAKQDADTVTLATSGCFDDPARLSQFLSMLKQDN